MRLNYVELRWLSTRRCGDDAMLHRVLEPLNVSIACNAGNQVKEDLRKIMPPDVQLEIAETSAPQYQHSRGCNEVLQGHHPDFTLLMPGTNICDISMSGTYATMERGKGWWLVDF